MTLPPDDEKRMNDYAAKARVEFKEQWERWTVRDVAVWWEAWCRRDRTNHDRLGQILMEETGVIIRKSDGLKPGAWEETDDDQ